MKLRRRIRDILSVVLASTMLMPLMSTGQVARADGKKKELEGNQLNHLTSFSLDEVIITDGYMDNALQLVVDYLLEFNVDKLLAGFRETAGIDMKGQTRYGGWENSLIGGHSVGHYLTACAQAYKNAGVTKEDKDALYKQITELVDGLLECQKNSKGKEGFIFAAKIVDPNNVELQFDNVERRKANIMTEAWVPWYTMHKIIAGLVDVYNLTAYDPAKVVASALGDWTYNRASSWSRGVHDAVIGIEYGGMNDCLYDLYLITGDEKHGKAAHMFDEDHLFQKVYNQTPNALNGRHANTTIPKFLGGLKRYIALDGKIMDGEKVDASQYLEYAKVFWDTVVNRHSYITGGNSEWEHFGYDYILDAERTNCNNETCNIYNMLKLSRELFQITGERKYADYYENAYINSILSSQNPETGMTMYFQPMDSGYFKVYGSKFSHFWCCTGSGMENFTKLNDSIYYRKDKSLVVNMYVSSEVTWEEKNVTLVQNSEIPYRDTSVFTVNALNGKTVDMDLVLRVPDWATDDVTVMINGKKETVRPEGGYIHLERQYRHKDEVSITIPMAVVPYGLADNDTVFGFKYGPLVLSAELGTLSMHTTTTGMNVTIPKDKKIESEDIIIKEGLGTKEEFLKNINEYFIRKPGTMEFQLTGIINQELTFSPHYHQHQQRYGIYWGFYSYEDSLKRAEEGIRFDYLTLDSVKPGLGQYESDNLHNMTQYNSFAGTSEIYRYAGKEGWFTYQMNIDPLKDNYILCSFQAEDNDKTIQLSIDGTIIYRETLNYQGDLETYQVRIRIPREVVDEKKQIVIANGQPNWVVAVTFAGMDGQISAKVSEMILTVNMEARYDVDKSLAYFVDCGDHDVTTVSKGDAFGIYNSLTEQLYGEDPVTGYRWGLVDDSNDQYGGANISDAIYTANTWAYEFAKTDGIAKTESNRYTKNQLESGITPRLIDYKFELPNGTYTIEVGFSDPWGVSNQPSLYANMGKENEILIADLIEVGSDPVAKGQIVVSDGELTINLRSNNSAINVTYIKIGILEDEDKITAIKEQYEEAKLQLASKVKEAGETMDNSKGEDSEMDKETLNHESDRGKKNTRSGIILGIVGTVLAVTTIITLVLRHLKKRK